jgi:hypothetical protein
MTDCPELKHLAQNAQILDIPVLGDTILAIPRRFSASLKHNLEENLIIQPARKRCNLSHRNFKKNGENRGKSCSHEVPRNPTVAAPCTEPHEPGMPIKPFELRRTFSVRADHIPSLFQ